MFITAKKKLIIVGIASSIVFIGAGVGGWALTNYYRENVKTPTQQLDEAIEKKIIPSVSEELNNFSSQWMSVYSTDKDFDFTTVNGYNSKLKYNIVKKEAIAQELKVTVKVSANDYQSSNYEVMIANKFATPEISSQTVIKQTIDVLPSYVENVNVSTLPQPDSTVVPETIVFNSSEFKKDALGNFIYERNGSNLKALKTIDLYSKEPQITEFITEYIAISGTTSTEEEIRNEIGLNIKKQNTIILFEINDGGSAENKSATIMVKDFSNVDFSNFIENASELPLSLNNPNLTPTAQEVITSINDNNPEKYLIFTGLPSTSNFKYTISEVSTVEGDIKEETLMFTVTITQVLNQNTKTYTTTLNGLLSVQQNELNNIMASVEYNQWAIKPRISTAYTNKTIDEIIKSPNLEAFQFSPTELQRYPGYDYIVSNPTKILLAAKPAISVYVEMVNKENPSVKIGYYVNITTGFKP